MHEIVEQELEDFNEEEDYVKFMQKENMSPMIPKVKPDQKKLPIPVVTCEWSDKKSANKTPTYLPVTGLGMVFFCDIKELKWTYKLRPSKNIEKNTEKNIEKNIKRIFW